MAEPLPLEDRLSIQVNKLSLQPYLSNAEALPCVINKANFPCVCINNHGTAVAVFQNSGQIFSVLGTVSTEQSTSIEKPETSNVSVHWGLAQLIGDGCNVQVAINDEGEVLIVYSECVRRVCLYRGGTVQKENKIIQWWEEKPCKLSNGMNPTVAMKGRTALLIYEADYGTYRSFYRVCEIRENTIWMGQEQRLSVVDGYKQISVAISKSGRILLSCRNIAFYTLYYALGQLVGCELRDITSLQSYGSGYFNHVSILDNSWAISVHESYTGSSVMLKYGTIEQSSNTVSWHDESSIDTGYRITAAVNDSRQMIVLMVWNGGYGEGVVMYKVGSLVAQIL